MTLIFCLLKFGDCSDNQQRKRKRSVVCTADYGCSQKRFGALRWKANMEAAA